MADKWHVLLTHLAGGARENGTPEMDAAAGYLERRLRAAGLDVELEPFTALPYEPLALAVVVLGLSALYLWLIRSQRFVLAALAGLLLLAAPVAQLDAGLPLSGGVGAVPARNVIARLDAAHASQRLVFTAHYDTKTDPTDHIVRAPIRLVGLPLCLAAMLAPLAASVRRRGARIARVVGWVVAGYGVVFAITFGAGVILPSRSHGALDNGAACAVLVELLEGLVSGPPLARTSVEVIFFAAEEVGAQGSVHHVARSATRAISLPTAVVNLDPVGASHELVVVGREGALLRSYEPPPMLVALLDTAHQAAAGRPIGHTRGGGLTDAFAFLAAGIPAATVISAVPPFVLPRGMHTAADRRERIDESALDFTQTFLQAFVHHADAVGLPGLGASH